MSSRSAEAENGLVAGLFAAYHELEKDITVREVLQELAATVGLEKATMEAWLDDGANKSRVDQEAEGNRQRVLGSGVPAFIIQGIHRIEGGGDPQAFMEAFIKIKEREPHP